MTEAVWTIIDVTPALGIGTYREWLVQTNASAHDAYTVTLAPATYGKIISVYGCDLTNGAVEAPAWVQSTGVITIGGSSNVAARSYKVVCLR